MNDNPEPICRRAMRFAETLNFDDPVIVDVRDANEAVVSKRGSGNPSEYRTVRIELQMSAHNRQKMVELAGPNDADELKRFLDGTWTFDSTCSATDVILEDTPFIDLD